MGQECPDREGDSPADDSLKVDTPIQVDAEFIAETYRDFCLPLVFYRHLGAGQQAISSLAQNLWTVLLGGPAMEQEFWASMDRQATIDASVLASVRTCFEEEMKPRVSAATLAAVRRHYGIVVQP